ncbi:hypothetical protein NDU88_009037 [Pleurodeles waltl]|uniref:Uncharacterized protein n=1 Tax=Pleurodeles waltl TaxID=8319 RepID=A0AAV7P2P7_PLEWA|nr:hypothetical protein NDU88_009037 [Pleurodeles waltl]
MRVRKSSFHAEVVGFTRGKLSQKVTVHEDPDLPDAFILRFLLHLGKEKVDILGAKCPQSAGRIEAGGLQGRLVPVQGRAVNGFRRQWLVRAAARGLGEEGGPRLGLSSGERRSAAQMRARPRLGASPAVPGLHHVPQQGTRGVLRPPGLRPEVCVAAQGLARAGGAWTESVPPNPVATNGGPNSEE